MATAQRTESPFFPPPPLFSVAATGPGRESVARGRGPLTCPAIKRLQPHLFVFGEIHERHVHTVSTALPVATVAAVATVANQ